MLQKIVYYFLIITHNSRDYLRRFLLEKSHSYDPTRINSYRTSAVHTDYLKIIFLLTVSVNETNLELWNSESILVFEKALLVFIRLNNYILLILLIQWG